MVDIGSRIKQLRVSQKITQRDFAARIGVTKSTISAYENGSRLPSYDILIKISTIFKVSTDYLLGCIDEKVQTISVHGLTDTQMAYIKNSIKTFRVFNMVREQVPKDVQKQLDEFVEFGTYNGKSTTFPE